MQPMILIADSGSTKTDWCLTRQGERVAQVATQGINPFYQTDEEIETIIRGELLSRLCRENAEAVASVCYYGAGIRPEMKERMKTLMAKVMNAGRVEVENDLLGAARALFGRGEGIACILGTGSNSGRYDGKAIVANTPPLGFILGDEGSGAVLGKLFLGALYKGLLPAALAEEFHRQTGQTVASVIQAVYRQPLPNRFLASFSPFIHAHLHVAEVRQLVVDNFRSFFRRNLAQYGRRDLPVGVIGSIACHYEAELREAAEAENFHVKSILRSPLDGLVAFHQLI